MRIIIACCVAVLLTLPLGAQDTARSRFESIRMQTLRTLDSTNHSRTVAGTSKSSASRYVIGGAIIAAIAAGAGLALYFKETHAEFVGSPIVFVPLFAASTGIGAGIGYILYRARH
jgi:hypothetical protein